MTGKSRCVALVVLCGWIGIIAALAATPGGASEHARSGSLTLDGVLAMTSTPSVCPPDAPPEASLCASRLGNGDVPGLGRVTETYMFYVEEAANCGGLRVLETTGKLEVAGKGTIGFALSRSEGCVPSALTVIRRFTIVGGSGIYAGASGGGTVTHRAHYTLTGSAGPDTWNGTLTVPGLEFDVAPPTLSGLANRTIRARKGAKRMRVKFAVTAQDQVDGPLQATCRPKSGSRFRIGRTVVKCSATDSSANTVSGKFRVAVKRRR
jgi:HYR domain